MIDSLSFGLSHTVYTLGLRPIRTLVMRFIYAIKAVFYILISGEDAIDLVERMYEWTDHKDTSWATRAKHLIGR